MRIERTIRITGTRVLLILLAGALVAMTLLSVGQQSSDGSCTSEDKTFCIAQHPSPTVAAAAEAAGRTYADAGLPFIIPEVLVETSKIDRSRLPSGDVLREIPERKVWQPIWSRTPDRKRALVSICLMGGSGSATVEWTEESARLDPGDSITVLSDSVRIGYPSAKHLTAEECDERGLDYSPPVDPITGELLDRTIALVDEYVLVEAVYGTYTVTIDLCD
jgi:hypothetical protein